MPDDEWDAFIESMRAPLPTTFRITSGKPTARQLLSAMQNVYVPYLSNVEFEGEKIAPPRPLDWYPESLAWHVDVRKNVLRKSTEFRRLQQFLVHETDVGSISRQEAVSMLPPLLLDVRPEHLVLDMCAAPGSKTAQLIEAIHSPLTTEPDAFDPVPRGFVVANDSDTKRAHMLVHQAQRLPSPNLIVTNVDASSMPNVQVPWAGEDGKVVQRDLKFDRILTDVPCSGDGTLRKNLAIWKDWTPNNAIGLHSYVHADPVSSCASCSAAWHSCALAVASSTRHARLTQLKTRPWLLLLCAPIQMCRLSTAALTCRHSSAVEA